VFQVAVVMVAVGDAFAERAELGGFALQLAGGGIGVAGAVGAIAVAGQLSAAVILNRSKLDLT
jgi:hypothetical protein